MIQRWQRYLNPRKPTTLSVYYGAKKRWDQPLLERVQRALGREAVGFGGLQADFEYPTREAALQGLKVVQALDVPAEAAGVGEGPPQEAVKEAHRVMRASYGTGN